MIARLLPMILALFAALPALAQVPCPARRNVDCAGAQRAVDAAVAADPWLALLDRARGMRIAELLPQLGPEGAAELTRQDAAWRRSLSRELFFTVDGRIDVPDLRAALRQPLEHWVMRLVRVQSAPDGLDGRWMSARGDAVVWRAGPQRYEVTINTADINNLAWTCEYGGEGTADGADVVETEDGMIELRRDGPMLRIRLLPQQAPVPFCGAAGSVSGLYFRTGEAD